MIVIGGGSSGIGRAVATDLAGRGQQVLVTARRTDRLAELDTTVGIRTVTCDNTDPDDVDRLVAGIDEPITGLVLCAGGNPAIGRPAPEGLRAVAELVDETLAANVRSVALMTTGLRPHLADGASVVLFGSIAAERGVGYYGPAKAAVGSLAVGLAADLGVQGVRVNCIAPGYVADTEFFRGRITDERVETLRAQTLTGRTGQLEDAVGLVRFLLSPAARHLTGQTIHLDGGAHTTR
jgi:3-oxoacyl-[acyl-carrier protein] reductase